MEFFMLECLEYLARSAGPALLLYAGFVLIRWARSREMFFEPSMIWGYLWVWWLVTLLRVLGIDGLRIGWPWSIFHPVRFGIGLSGGGLARMVLDVLLFAPCGFLTPRAIKGVRWDMSRAAALGAMMSFAVGMMRAAPGGDVELVPVFLGAAGTAAGYLAHELLEALQRLRKGADAR